MPTYVNLNEEEGNEVANLLTDIETYMESTVLAWEVGYTELNDETEYVQTIQGMGIDAVIADYQAAYERYLER